MLYVLSAPVASKLQSIAFVVTPHSDPNDRGEAKRCEVELKVFAWNRDASRASSSTPLYSSPTLPATSKGVIEHVLETPLSLKDTCIAVCLVCVQGSCSVGIATSVGSDSKGAFWAGNCTDHPEALPGVRLAHSVQLWVTPIPPPPSSSSSSASVKPAADAKTKTERKVEGGSIQGGKTSPNKLNQKLKLTANNNPNSQSNGGVGSVKNPQHPNNLGQSQTPSPHTEACLLSRFAASLRERKAIGQRKQGEKEHDRAAEATDLSYLVDILKAEGERYSSLSGPVTAHTPELSLDQLKMLQQQFRWCLTRLVLTSASAGRQPGEPKTGFSLEFSRRKSEVIQTYALDLIPLLYSELSQRYSDPAFSDEESVALKLLRSLLTHVGPESEVFSPKRYGPLLLNDRDLPALESLKTFYNFNCTLSSSSSSSRLPHPLSPSRGAGSESVRDKKLKVGDHPIIQMFAFLASRISFPWEKLGLALGRDESTLRPPKPVKPQRRTKYIYIDIIINISIYMNQLSDTTL